MNKIINHYEKIFDSFTEVIKESKSNQIIRKKDLVGIIEFDGDEEVFGDENAGGDDMRNHTEQIANDLSLF